MFKTTALGSVGNAFVNKNGGDGTLVDAVDGNIHQDEIVNTVESGGRTLDPSGSDRSQLAEAMAVIAGGSGYQGATGGPVAYILTPKDVGMVYPAEIDGMDGVIVTANFSSIPNTGAGTMDWNGTGAVPILKTIGIPLAGGELDGWCYLFYSTALGAWYFMYSAENTAVADEAITMSKLNNGVVEGDNVRTRQILAFVTFKSNNGGGATIIYNSFNVLSVSREPFAGNHLITLKTGLSTAFGTPVSGGTLITPVASTSQSSVTTYNFNPTQFQLQCFSGASTVSDFDLVTFILVGKL